MDAVFNTRPQIEAILLREINVAAEAPCVSPDVQAVNRTENTLTSAEMIRYLSIKISHRT